MHRPARTQRLTPEVAGLVPPYDGPTLTIGTDRERASEDDHAAVLAGILAARPADGAVWLFAYGSLIWLPEFAHDADSIALVHGWHRAFCMGWMRSFRGRPARPGLMLALDRGGACRGVAFRLPAGQVEDSLLSLIRRELPFKASGMVPRWMPARTAHGIRSMLAFPVLRGSETHMTGQSEDQIVEMLATSAGPGRTMAEYLYSTISHLEQRGIHDRYLWKLQALVAERIGSLWPDSASSGNGRT